MKKYYKEMITIIVVVAILVTLIVFMVRGSNSGGNKLLPDDYYDKYVAEGKIEKEYQKIINRKALRIEYELDGDDLTKITYFLPDNLEDNEKCPVVIFVNEKDASVDMYDGVLKHLTSYGFICVGCDDNKAYKGKSTKFIYDHLLSVNNDEDEFLYNHVDVNNIGLYGHVHGGIGALNAITEYNVACKALVTTSLPSVNYLAEEEFEYIYDVTKVNTSWLYCATNGTKENSFNPIDDLNLIYDNTPSNLIMTVRNNIDYGTSMGCFDGYATAYFAYMLQGIEEANAFEIDGELSKNSLYSDFNRNY